MVWLIYSAKNIATGGEYIGVTKQRLRDRRLKHYSDAHSGRGGCRVFCAAINKYGREGFEWSVLAEGLEDGDLAMIVEEEFIAKRKPTYNVLSGGRGFQGQQKTKEHIEKVASQLRGRKRTPEQLERFRRVRSDPAYRQHQSEVLKGRKHSPERIEAIVAGRSPAANYKAVRCVEDGLSFPSQKDAAAHYGVARSTMSYALASPEHTVDGKHFVRLKKGEVQHG